AVIALDKVGSQRFETALKLGGLDVRRPGTFGGEQNLALALGGLGLRSEDLAMLYAGLANGGVVRPLVWQENQQPKKQYRIMRESSARKITKILRQAPTPDGRVPHWLSQDTDGIAYKTGTSYGFRDAWAAGYSKRYTVIAWVGRPDSAPRVGATGRKAAAPLMFEVFDILPNSHENTAYTKIAEAPKGLGRFGGAPDPAPLIIFPPDGSEILANTFGETATGMSFAARSSISKSLNWYVDGHPVKRNPSGDIVWKPDAPGFYQVSVVDERGHTTISNIRVMGIN
ncbi:MAG TPA: penicillin-binding protein 1C, partial [Hellea balneolensis]|nr:penicillin-binding protein 1C [Hellea balneolensis]